MSKVMTAPVSVSSKLSMTYIEFLDNSPMTWPLWFLLGGVILANLLDGMDFQMLSYGLPGIMKEFHLNPAQAGGAAAIGNLGYIAGTIISGLLSDRFGRKPVFTCVLLVFAFGSALTAMAHSYQSLLAARVIAGFGIGAEPAVSAAILSEFAPLRYRHFFLPAMAGIFSVGWVVAAFISIWCIPAYGWRSVFWIGVIPALLTVVVRFFLPESVRWLLTKGRTEEAGRIARKLAIRSGMGEIELVPPVVMKEEFKLSFGKRLQLLQKFWVPGVVMIFFYFCYSLQIFGMNAWLPTIFVRHGFTLVRSFNYSLIIFAMAPIAAVIGCYLQERMNRKFAILILTILATIFFISFGLSFQYHWPVKVLVGSQVLQSLSVNGIIAIFFTLLPETFPTPARSLGFGLVQGLGRFGSVVGPFALGLFLNFGTEISQIIYLFAAPLMLAAILMSILLKQDPRQRTLEQLTSEALAGR